MALIDPNTSSEEVYLWMVDFLEKTSMDIDPDDLSQLAIAEFEIDDSDELTSELIYELAFEAWEAKIL